MSKESHPRLLDSLFVFKNVDDMTKRFGKENVVVGRYGIELATFLFPKTKHEVVIGWLDQKTQSGGMAWVGLSKDPAAIFNGGDERFPISRWETSKGLFLGMTLKELEKKNGKPFKFMHDGIIIDWNDGALANEFVKIDPDGFSSIAETSSDDPVAQELNPIVSSISIFSQEFFEQK